MHEPWQYLKLLLATITIMLPGCSGEMLLLPDRQEMKFKCDMDPYRQGCERMMDYQEHYRRINKPAT
ncbi:hypothetical protein ACU5P1_21225 [Pseudomonas plecoglossicida]|uniref:Uncharacterized protein n=1 Tax=Pseudomonas plecoglossicida TaxID=70775 RepID=A0AAD0QWP0_PSEDL|nr:hypothetical protein [Pseudomonas plecoglossicida]AXM96363.1 hypothetical protein DVB73_11500 [Pseudomonas plecoglossicida]EPB93206.1 hypothetical protein L321_23656 [Pseudomonas plecoglossicida NB2011]QLB57117.1 hypothetical protein HAV28_21010 [Pseudomonas plecoglossicida]